MCSPEQELLSDKFGDEALRVRTSTGSVSADFRTFPKLPKVGKLFVFVFRIPKRIKFNQQTFNKPNYSGY